ncbi:hypothetical protein BDQ17DRAFT_1065665 [Cyathus striatus]|nr:hypothetical protein BDQ17DRAFT_1065665 [Cyathus striatus]
MKFGDNITISALAMGTDPGVELSPSSHTLNNIQDFNIIYQSFHHHPHYIFKLYSYTVYKIWHALVFSYYCSTFYRDD